MAKFWGALFIYLTSALFTSYGAQVDQGLADKAANFAMSVYNHNSKEEFLYKLLSFDFKKIQVIAGTEYIINAKIELTNCQKSNYEEPEECSSSNTRDNLKRQQCHFVVVVLAGERKGLLQSICREHH
ncbi:cystatin-like [Alosa sapidissima]|uniref:cystatin-like n=1 Tax=Alosa sapidissima TaxID=34773 RepID=UPI001C094193|nr:cystatin-like [Alosa sapidissima]